MEIREPRATTLKQAREILEGAEKEHRGMNADEEARYNKAFGDA
jgi:hypothetical protein